MAETQKNTDELYMERTLLLAKQGLGSVSNNPVVGCVVVYNDTIIGEGYHHRYGEAHAEVNAINSVVDKSVLPHSTLYVSLEPCAHHGKTPPCADLIVAHRLKRVVIGTIDTYSKVAGKGIEKLKNAGIAVDVGVLQAECRYANRRFFVYNEKKRPFVILKWAQTADGFMGRGVEGNALEKSISHPLTNITVHRWRTEEDAILVGTATALLDNPSLTARHWQGKNPTRVLLDYDLKVPPTNAIFSGDSKTICINSHKTMRQGNIFFERVNDTQIETVLEVLYQHKIQSVIVEGGAKTLQHFIATNLWDEARIIHAQKFWGVGIKAPALIGEMVDEQTIATDTVFTFLPTPLV